MTRKFIKYVLQSVAGMVGLSVYILADTFFISIHSGADGLAVLNLILPIYGVIYGIGSMIGIGSATKYSIKRASGEDTDCYFLQSVQWSILASIPFLFMGIFIPEKLLLLFGTDNRLAELGTGYLRIILMAAPLFMTNYTFTAFARNDNAPSTAMAGSISGSLFNIVFDYLFMFRLNLGFPGAALATALSPVVTMAVCSTHYLGKKNGIVFQWKRPSIRHVFSCCQLGVSAFVGEMSSAVTTVIFNTLILRLAGNVGVAAYGIIANISVVAMSIFNGISQGVQPLISESYGSDNQKQVSSLLRKGILVCLMTEFVIVSCVWGMTDLLVGIFNSTNDVLLSEYAYMGLRYYFLGFLFAGVNILSVAYFSATDNARIAFIGSIMRGAVAIVICAVVLSKLLLLKGIWLSFLAAELITFIVIVIIAIAQRKEIKLGAYRSD